MIISILDDHPLIGEGLKVILSGAMPDVEILSFSSVEEIKCFVEKQSIDVALVDLHLEDANGFEFLEYIQAKGLETKPIVFTSSMDYCDYSKSMAIGVSGYVAKSALPEDLIYAIKSALRGRRYVDPYFLGAFDDSMKEYDALTERESEVFELIGKGFNNSEIAERLFISVNTVKKHVTQIFSKIDVTDRTQAALAANDYFRRWS